MLCRTNNRAGYISQAMEQQGVPHLTVETYEFFRRQEVKDALAYLKLLLNPDDRLSLIRMLRRPTRGIGEQSIKKIESHADSGLRLTDITVHQAKGLEFDVVFMAGLSEYEFPNYGATKKGREQEELRLFNVGITRAKTHLFLSWYEAKNGRYRNPSPYLKLLPQQPPSRIHYRR